MSASRELIERVRELAEGSPYAIEETPKGFDLRLDLVNASRRTLLYEKRLTKVVTHHVRLDEASRTVKIVDDVRTVSWIQGPGGEDGPVPVLSAEAERVRGRSIEVSRRVEYGRKDGGEPAETAHHHLDSREGHRIIRTAAREAGWKERMPAEVKGALVMAVIGGLGGLAAGVTLLVRWLLGY